ncbi:response regulator [Oryzomonas japonica]|uniref:Response regulator n=1 Tax=Oryzomonas japonica TaxID=2603858 RepID=A0A7J4ZSH7_9BACT|nr:ATPase, T2SS/T4P/T4SS family [Oryzomonas japonica]KAB0666023.1 response regulator [Oryzomonas japonica]
MSTYAELFRSMGGGSGAGRDEEIEIESPPQNEFCLLFVDDEEGVLGALRRIFMEESYTIFTANSAAAALEIMASRPIHLIISDHRMPGMTGAELLKKIKETWPATIRIMLTGYADVNSIMGAVKDGAVYKFITKPWNDEDLRLTVSLALQQYVLMQENRRLRDVAKRQQATITKYAGLFDEGKGILGDLLQKEGAVSREVLLAAQQKKELDEFLGDTLVRLGIITENAIVRVLQKHLGIDFIDLREMEINPATAAAIPKDICVRHRILPVKLEGGQLTLAMADPSDLMLCDNISRITGLKILPYIALSSEIGEALAKLAGGKPDTGLDEALDIEPLDEIDIVIEEEEAEVSVQELIGSSKVPPVIRIVNAIISEAIRYRASDIHIEPKTKYTVIRLRIDGMLHSKIKIPSDLHAAVVSRLKILSKMDIAERRRPQDGRITVKAGARIVDMRVSSLPTLNGEKIVMRILDKSAAIKSLNELGVLADDLRKITVMSKKPQGVIIATGPTGSGKTTMLYSLLAAMMNSTRNFETIEEPVEYFMEEANQVSVHEKIGLSFSQVLRSTLRQDPDVILVGEIRDQDTADVAFKAALTGHMVLSSLHTNSAVASITRLIDMGIKPYIIASALEGLIAQRLVRQVCKNCAKLVPPDKDLLEMLRVPAGFFTGGVFVGSGCDVCNTTGYHGRIGIFEVFIMNDDFRQLIGSAYKETEVLELARASGMRTLLEDALEKVRLGWTTMEEVLRVIGPSVYLEQPCLHCGRAIEAKFVFCPYCGAVKENRCWKCRLPVEVDWIHCPFCGVAQQGTMKEGVDR